nr:hypothetical protein [uncultured Duganella sp.]
MKASTDDLPRHAALKQFPAQHDGLQPGGEMRGAVAAPPEMPV